MSIIDDYAAIGKAMRELTEPGKTEPEPPKRRRVNPWPSCDLCADEGWIAVRRGSMWNGVPCVRCGNPAKKRNPIG